MINLNKENEFEKQARLFLEKANAKISIVKNGVVDRFPGDDKPTGHRQRYIVTISRNGLKYSMPFYGSVKDYEENRRISAYDVLDCLEKYEVPLDIFDFAAEFGYSLENGKDFRNEKILLSYNTEVAKITESGEVVRLWDGISQTTSRHFNSFLIFYGLPPVRFGSLEVCKI